jgi:hypothetical protein
MTNFIKRSLFSGGIARFDSFLNLNDTETNE